MKKKKVLMWFRRDLRVADNVALTEAAKIGEVFPLFIFDSSLNLLEGQRTASDSWLNVSLSRLSESLHHCLVMQKGKALEVILSLCEKNQIDAVVWNRMYEPQSIERDRIIKSALIEKGLQVKSYNSLLLWEPWTVKHKSERRYQVFTPFYRQGCLKSDNPRVPLPAPLGLEVKKLGSLVDAFSYCEPQKRQWEVSLLEGCAIGENAAEQKCDHFIKNGLKGYKSKRNFPAKSAVSQLSPHLHFGEISPNTVWHKVKAQSAGADSDHFCSELGWREFSYYLLYHQPQMTTENLKTAYEDFPWGFDEALFDAWRYGKTGFPFIDAGMRQLYKTGYMHNRLRMQTASFLTKNCFIHWRYGYEWFLNCLFDADVANNAAGWQWSSGAGVDSAPYCRVFNPITQSKKFDEDASFIKYHVPELKHLPVEFVHEPWLAPEDVLAGAGVVLGQNYPHRIVDFQQTSQQAQQAFQQLGMNS